MDSAVGQTGKELVQLRGLFQCDPVSQKRITGLMLSPPFDAGACGSGFRRAGWRQTVRNRNLVEDRLQMLL